jgi:hypothetical protein
MNAVKLAANWSKGLPRPRRWFGAQALAGLLFLPWLLVEGSRIPADADRTIGGAATQPFTFAAEIATTLAAGYPARGTVAGAALAVLLFALATTGLIGGRLRAAPRALLAAALLTPVAVGVLVSLRFPYDAPRFFIVCAPALAVLVAAGCRALARRAGRAGRLAAAVTLVGSLAATLPVYAQPSLSDDYRPLLAALVAGGQPGDLVLCGYPWQAGYVAAYAPGRGRAIFPIPDHFETLARAAPHLWVLYYQTPEGPADYLRTRLEAQGLRRTLALTAGASRIARFE